MRRLTNEKMHQLFSALTRIAAVAGFLILVAGLYSAQGVSQQAAVAVIAIALAVLP